MRRVPQHVDIQQFCNVVVPRKRILLLEGGPNGRRLFLDERSFICESLQFLSIFGPKLRSKRHTLQALIALINAGNVVSASEVDPGDELTFEIVVGHLADGTNVRLREARGV